MSVMKYFDVERGGGGWVGWGYGMMKWQTARGKITVISVYYISRYR